MLLEQHDLDLDAWVAIGYLVDFDTPGGLSEWELPALEKVDLTLLQMDMVEVVGEVGGIEMENFDILTELN